MRIFQLSTLFYGYSNIFLLIALSFWYNADQDASYGKTGQLLRVSGAAVPFRTVRSTAMLARSATGEVNTVIYLYPAC